MREIVPGIWHWTSEHPKWGIVIHSYVLPEERVVIDPMASPEVLDELERLGPPTDVLLTNRHHYRSSGELRKRFGATVRCTREGMHEFTSDQVVQPFDFGDELPGGIVAHRVGSICPDETALHVPSRRTLALADGAIRLEAGAQLAFVPDHLMDDPERTKTGLRDAYRRLAAELDFDHLLLAHGEPFVGDGRTALAAFAA